MGTIKKVAVFGLDCAEPTLVFDQWLNDLPNMKRLIEAGTYGDLTSSMPPITVPAWSCMTASKDPGTLGIYGFRNRADHTYDKLSIATSLAVKEPRLWNIIGGHAENNVTGGARGTTISGGGFAGFPNSVGGNYATVAGGSGNNADAQDSTVGGGAGNTANGPQSAVGT